MTKRAAAKRAKRALKASQKTIPYLPSDVIEIIFSHRFPDLPSDILNFPSDAFDNQEDLHPEGVEYMSSLCLVSRTWLTPARRVLYRTITEYHSDIALLWNTIFHCPHLRIYIRRMFLQSQAAKAQFRELGPQLPQCVVFETVSTCAPLTETSDHACYLRVIGEQYYHPGELWPAADGQWSHLKVLEYIGAQQFYLSFSDDLPFLRVIKFRSLDTPRFPSISTNTLHTLAFSNCRKVHIPSFFDFILRHSQSLLRLSIDFSRYAFYNHSLPGTMLEDAIVQLQALESLIICNLLGVTDKFLLRLPPSLKELMFLTWFHNLSYKNIHSLITERATESKLRSVEILLHDNAIITMCKDNRGWLFLPSMGRRRGVQFLIGGYDGANLHLPSWCRE
jgi:hypothetical protein